ncbi:glycosyltransferase [Sulfitobacter sediminilitoris]|uniref:glycosyltransferase n=1 Tax=Sulfitobacter sediminilitoris TaxID=2698830 RepID=UPI00360FB4A8
MHKQGERIMVAEVEPVGGHGGMDYYDFGLCKGLSLASVDVVLYTSDKTIPPRNPEFEVKHVYYRVFGRDSAFVRGIRYIRGTLFALIDARRKGAMIVHFHLFNTGLLEYLNLFLSKLFGFLVVLTVHDVESFLNFGNRQKKARFLYKRADLIIVHNEVSRKELTGLIGEVPGVVVIPHGNYCSYYEASLTKLSARRRLGLDPIAPIFLFLARSKRSKGWMFLLMLGNGLLSVTLMPI